MRTHERDNRRRDQQDTFSPKYPGNGKTVYLLDSGINNNHIEFANATITNLWTAFDTNPNGDAYASDYEDSVGHGTAVGSLIVGENIGTSPDATLMNVKLYNEAVGTTSIGNVVTAFNQVLTHHNANDNTDVKVICRRCHGVVWRLFRKLQGSWVRCERWLHIVYWGLMPKLSLFLLMNVFNM